MSLMPMITYWYSRPRRIPPKFTQGSDPASKVSVDSCASLGADHLPQRFIPKLKDHLLSRLLNRDFDGDETEFSDAQRNTVKIVQHKIYSVQTMRVNFTTYDMRRDQDIINPGRSPTSWSFRQRPLQILIHSAMHACWVFFTSRLFIQALNPAMGRCNTWNSCGSDGTVRSLAIDPVSRLHAYRRLGSCPTRAITPSAFWILPWFYGDAIWSRHLQQVVLAPSSIFFPDRSLQHAQQTKWRTGRISTS